MGGGGWVGGPPPRKILACRMPGGAIRAPLKALLKHWLTVFWKPFLSAKLIKQCNLQDFDQLFRPLNRSIELFSIFFFFFCNTHVRIVRNGRYALADSATFYDSSFQNIII